MIVTETEEVFFRDETAAEAHEPGRSNATLGQDDIRLGQWMVERQMGLLHEKIAVGEHHSQRDIFVGSRDEQFVRNRSQ